MRIADPSVQGTLNVHVTHTAHVQMGEASAFEPSRTTVRKRPHLELLFVFVHLVLSFVAAATRINDCIKLSRNQQAIVAN